MRRGTADADLGVRHAASRWIAAAAACLAACAPLPTRSISSSHLAALDLPRREVVPPSNAAFVAANDTAEKRGDTLDRVWRTIESEYFDATFSGIDLPAVEERSRIEMAAAKSDADFYRILKNAVGNLPDSHSGVLTPREVEYAHTDREFRLGVQYRVVEGRVVVTKVATGSPADEAGVRPGMVVEAIDGRTIDATLVEGPAPVDGDRDAAAAALLAAVSRLLPVGAELPRAHRLTLLRSDDERLEIEVTARDIDVPTIADYRRLPSGIGVLRLSRFDPSVISDLERGIEVAAQDSRGLILDLRDDPGGDSEVFERLVGLFLAKPASLGTVTTRLFRIPFTITMDGEPAPHPYLRPIAVLIDGGTASAAELTAHALVELRGALPVGQATCGCVVGLLREFALPDGGGLFIAELGFRSPRGRRMERDPLKPAIEVDATLAQLRGGEDAALEAAERALLERTDAAPSPALPDAAL